eukprot:Pgem_evm1s19897
MANYNTQNSTNGFQTKKKKMEYVKWKKEYTFVLLVNIPFIAISFSIRSGSSEYYLEPILYQKAILEANASSLEKQGLELYVRNQTVNTQQTQLTANFTEYYILKAKQDANPNTTVAEQLSLNNTLTQLLVIKDNLTLQGQQLLADAYTFSVSKMI